MDSVREWGHRPQGHRHQRKIHYGHQRHHHHKERRQPQDIGQQQHQQQFVERRMPKITGQSDAIPR